RVKPGKRKTAVGTKLERQPNVARFRQVPLVPSVGDENKKVVPTLNRKYEGALGEKCFIRIITHAWIGQLTPGAHRRIRHAHTGRVGRPGSAARRHEVI